MTRAERFIIRLRRILHRVRFNLAACAALSLLLASPAVEARHPLQSGRNFGQRTTPGSMRTLFRPAGAKRFKAFTYKTTRTHYVSDKPDRASKVVNNMRLSDAATGIPPMVSARKVGPGSFKAQGPGVSVTAKLKVRPHGSGSKIVETVKANSLLPCMALGAATYHNTLGTSLEKAYSKASRRTR